MKLRILHVIQQLSLGGASRSLVAIASHSGADGSAEHRVISLCPSQPAAVALAQARGIQVLVALDDLSLDSEIDRADIVQIHFWNTPEIFEFIRRCTRPSRIVLWSHVAGDSPPHVLSEPLLRYADTTIAACPYSFELDVFRRLDETTRQETTAMVYDSADFARLAGVRPQPHEGFVVGYLGTVDFVKMHPGFVAMSARIDVPGVRFPVCGEGAAFATLDRQARALGIRDRFEFRKYAGDIASILGVLDVFGYPLCAGNYSAADLVLQEAMYAGIPPVVFAHGGAQSMVVDGETGLVVRSEREYSQAVASLYHDGGQRRRLGLNAAQYARRIFGAERAAAQAAMVYERLMIRPRRAREFGGPDRPAARFVEALAGTAPGFRVSLCSHDSQEIMEAERDIAASPPSLVDAASGGVLHYRRHYPDDPYLRIWSGLVLQANGRPALAAAEFRAAIDRGASHWRVSWYLAQAAAAAGAGELARQALDAVLRDAPEFGPALEWRASGACAMS